MDRLQRHIVTALLLVGLAVPLSAQEPLAIRIEPRVGILSPDTYVYERYTNFSGDGPVEWTDGSLGRALVVGVGIEIGRTSGGVLVRGEIARSFNGWLSVAHSIVMPRVLYDPPYVATTWLDVPTTVTLTSLELVVPTRVMIRRAQPYVVAGVGGKRYGFGEPTAANDVGAILPSSGFTWGGDVGAGITVPFLGLTLDLQGRDAITRYWGKTQHDVLWSGGVLWRVR